MSSPDFRNCKGELVDLPAVPVSCAEYEALLAGMQSAESKKAMQAAFDASPAELGRAAVKAARIVKQR